MTQNAQHNEFRNQPLVEHSVVLIAENVDPSIINPDFLRDHGIYSDRQITLEIIDAKENAPDQLESPGLLFNANIHRNLAETGQRDRIERLATVLTSWENDMDEFNCLVAQYYSACVAS